MARQFDPSDSGYVDVAARIVEFRTKHPDGCLQPADLTKPYEVVTIGQDAFVLVVAAAYRSPDDPRPGIGMAYESYPGRTPYTKGSELQNAETSAWGRAIVAALAADTKRGIASAEEVRNRQAERDGSWEDAQPARSQPGRDVAMERGRAAIAAAADAAQLAEAQGKVVTLEGNGTISTEDAAVLMALVHAREAELNGNRAPQAAGASA